MGNVEGDLSSDFYISSESESDTSDDSSYQPIHPREQEVIKQQLRMRKENEALYHMSDLFRDLSKHEIMRFLIARNYDIANTTEMICSYRKWREEYKPADCDDILFHSQLAKGKIYVLKCNRDPMIYIVGKEHQSKPDNADDVLKFGIYVLELILRYHPINSVLVIINCMNMGWKHIDLKLFQDALRILLDYYPERLRHCMICGFPKSLTCFWTHIDNSFDERTRQKIRLVKKSECMQVNIPPHDPLSLLPHEKEMEEVAENSKSLLIALHEQRQAELLKPPPKHQKKR